MRQPVLYVAVAILVVATGVLLLFGRSDTIAGMTPSTLANVAYLSIFALLVATSLAYGRHRIHARLWHVAVWLAVFVVLVMGYRWFHSEPTVVIPAGTAQSI